MLVRIWRRRGVVGWDGLLGGRVLRRMGGWRRRRFWNDWDGRDLSWGSVLLVLLLSSPLSLASSSHLFFYPLLLLASA